jgi:CRP/FNR family cyclic AMP-dependent transcriptional regulator
MENSRKSDLLGVTFSERDISGYSFGSFGRIPAQERLGLFKLATLVQVHAGDQLICAGAKSDGFYILLQGKGEVRRSGGAGRMLVINRISVGEVVGEVAHLSGGYRTADVFSVESSIWARITADFSPEFTKEFPSFSYEVLVTMAKRVDRTTTQAVELATEDVPFRVLQALKGMAHGTESDGRDHGRISERPTHQRLAELVGTSREVVSRSIKILEDSGAIRQDGKSITIVNNRLP